MKIFLPITYRKNKKINLNACGQILIEAILVLSVLLLFLTLTMQVCMVSLNETRHFRMTEKEVYGTQTTRN